MLRAGVPVEFRGAGRPRALAGPERLDLCRAEAAERAGRGRDRGGGADRLPGGTGAGGDEEAKRQDAGGKAGGEAHVRPAAGWQGVVR